MQNARRAALLSALLLLAGCGVTAGGVRGEIAFRATATVSEYVSARPPREVAACFARTAQLLPFSLIADDPVDGTPTYRLRYKEFWFEQIAFRAAPGGGTRIEVASSGNYDGKWTTLLVRDRLEPLGRCMSPALRAANQPIALADAARAP